MSESKLHKELKCLALRWMKSKVTDLVCPEVDFYNIRCVADVVGINFKRKEIRVIEVKVTKKDLLRDKKLFDINKTYFNHCHYCYIMCPKNVIELSDLPYGYGLLWVDELVNIDVVKKPTKYSGKLKTMFETTAKLASKKITNLFLYQEENTINKDETNGFFDKKSKIKMISFKCFLCKKQIKELIHVEDSYIVCDCGNVLNLKELRYREVTGFNKKFIEKIKKFI